MKAGRDSKHIGAIFTNRLEAEAAVNELRTLGIADEHLGIAIHEPGQLVYEEDVENDEAIAAEEGALVGAPVGVIAGMALIALVLPGVGPLSAGGLLAAGGAAGALIGGFVGGVAGLATIQHEAEERRKWEDHHLPPGEVLVVARDHQQPTRVSSVLTGHGGRLVEAHSAAT